MIRCLLCRKISLIHICSSCQKTFLTPSLTTRTIEDDFKVFSFYNYGDIAPLLKTKHTYIGAAVYTILAKCAMREFSKNFSFDSPVYAIGIDDHSRAGYAHTAILTKALKSATIQPLYHALRAKNRVSYSGKNLAYRESHSRGFRYHDRDAKDIILVDDIITTGTTILEAKIAIENAASTPLFAITLADARQM